MIGLLGMATGASAQALQGVPHYMWTDAHGVRQFSDSLTPDAIAQGYDVVSASGTVTQHVNRALTPAEQTQQKADQAAQAKVDATAKAQVQADQQLLAAYPTEKDLQGMQKDALAALDGQIQTAQMNVKSQQQALTSLVDQAATIETEKKPVPVVLNNHIKAQQQVVHTQQIEAQRMQAKRDQLVTDQAAQLAHYRTLRAAQAATP
jgi:hypothetical protein